MILLYNTLHRNSQALLNAQLMNCQESCVTAFSPYAIKIGKSSGITMRAVLPCLWILFSLQMLPQVRAEQPFHVGELFVDTPHALFVFLLLLVDLLHLYRYGKLMGSSVMCLCLLHL